MFWGQARPRGSAWRACAATSLGSLADFGAREALGTVFFSGHHQGYIGIHRVSICFAEYLRYVIGGVGFNASKETFQPSRNATLYDIDTPILAQLRI